MNNNELKKALQNDIRYHKDAWDSLEKKLEMIEKEENNCCCTCGYCDCNEDESELETITVDIEVNCDENSELSDFIAEYIGEEIPELIGEAIAIFFDEEDECNCEECQMHNKFEEFKRLVNPLNEWLQDNYNPHTSIIIEFGHAKIVSDELGIPLKVRD